MVVLRGGTHIDKDEKERRARAGTYRGMRDARLLLKLQHPESNRSNFKANSVANRKPMQIRKNRCDVAEPRFYATTRARVFWTH